MDLKSLKEKITDKTGLSSKALTYIIIVICAAALLIALNSLENKDDETVKAERTEAESESLDYEKAICEQLETVISQIEGVGKVSIMITFEGTASNEYQADIDKSETDETQKTVIIGNKEALVKSIKNPKAAGVLVVCEGGDSLKVKEKVINAVSTVLNISSGRVYVTNRIKER